MRNGLPQIYYKYITTTFDPKLPEFDSCDPEQSVIEWIEKAELLCRLCVVRRFEFVVRMHLTGGAYALYRQLSEERKKQLRLYTAFGADSFAAFE